MIRYILLLGACFIMFGCETTQSAVERLNDGSKIPSQETREEIHAAEMSFDVETGEIKYTLPEPALVRIRIGLPQGGPLLHNVVDWEVRSDGPHVEVWDKRDSSGKVFFGDRSDYLIVVTCQPLEAKGPKGVRQSPDLEIIFPQTNEHTEGGLPVLKGIMPVRITLAPEDKQWLNETKYELGIYIDYVFLMEDEEGIDPFTYHLNTENFSEGVHTITVNLVGYEGEVGTKSILAYIQHLSREGEHENIIQN